VDDLAELENYLDDAGRVTNWPSKRHRVKQRLVLKYLALKFDPTVTYTEKEVNALLRRYHCFNDPALLRRELFEAGWLDRKLNGSAYWRKDGRGEG
jgi:hypothetical protein